MEPISLDHSTLVCELIDAVLKAANIVHVFERDPRDSMFTLGSSFERESEHGVIVLPVDRRFVHAVIAAGTGVGLRNERGTIHEVPADPVLAAQPPKQVGRKIICLGVGLVVVSLGLD